MNIPKRKPIKLAIEQFGKKIISFFENICKIIKFENLAAKTSELLTASFSPIGFGWSTKHNNKHKNRPIFTIIIEEKRFNEFTLVNLSAYILLLRREQTRLD